MISEVQFISFGCQVNQDHGCKESENEHRFALLENSPGPGTHRQNYVILYSKYKSKVDKGHATLIEDKGFKPWSHLFSALIRRFLNPE